MRYDFITNEIIQNYKFFEIQFDDGEQKACVHGDDSIYIPTLGTEFGKKIGGGTDLFIDSKPTPTINVSSFGDHFTLIFKYNLISYISKLFLGCFFGFSLYVYDNKTGYYGFGNNSWWAYTNGFGNKYNTNYELAIEVKPEQLKIWLNGKLVSKTSSEVYRVKPYIWFGSVDDFAWTQPKFYLNDVFCINKSDFLPDQYTVNWREPWYELRYKHIYTHHDEAFYTK